MAQTSRKSRRRACTGTSERCVGVRAGRSHPWPTRRWACSSATRPGSAPRSGARCSTSCPPSPVSPSQSVSPPNKLPNNPPWPPHLPPHLLLRLWRVVGSSRKLGAAPPSSVVGVQGRAGQSSCEPSTSRACESCAETIGNRARKVSWLSPPKFPWMTPRTCCWRRPVDRGHDPAERFPAAV